MLKYFMNRRTFIKLAIQLNVIVILERKSVVSARMLAPTQATGYGQGAYGQAKYPGYKVYLPVVDK